MRHAAMASLVAPLLLLSLPCGCDRREAASKPAVRQELRPEPITGNAKEWGLQFTRQLLKRDDTGVAVGFEIANVGRGSVQFLAAPSASGPEAALLVELFEDGAWKRSPSSAPASAGFVDVWPDGNQYGRARITADVRWVRVLVQAKGLATADGRPVPGITDVFSDAFELPAE